VCIVRLLIGARRPDSVVFVFVVLRSGKHLPLITALNGALDNAAAAP
jgi:hypothetical protein